jgi:hypothetical protein
MALADGVSFVAASSGTGTFVYSSSRASFLTLAQAVTDGELTNGQTVSYLAVDSVSAPTQREWGYGTFSSSGSGSIARTTVLGGSAGPGTKVNFSVAPVVSLTALAKDFPTLATTSVQGLVQPDGTTIDVSAGVISAATATTSAPGIVEPDNATITISAGVISAAVATTSTPGIVQPDNVTIGISGSTISELNPPVAALSATTGTFTNSPRLRQRSECGLHLHADRRHHAQYCRRLSRCRADLRHHHLGHDELQPHLWHQFQEPGRARHRNGERQGLHCLLHLRRHQLERDQSHRCDVT